MDKILADWLLLLLYIFKAKYVSMFLPRPWQSQAEPYIGIFPSDSSNLCHYPNDNQINLKYVIQPYIFKLTIFIAYNRETRLLVLWC